MFFCSWCGISHKDRRTVKKHTLNFENAASKSPPHAPHQQLPLLADEQIVDPSDSSSEEMSIEEQAHPFVALQAIPLDVVEVPLLYSM